MSEYEMIYGIDGEEAVAEENSRFVVTTDGEAGWVFSKISEINAELEAETTRLNEQMQWYKDEIRKAQERHDRAYSYLEGLLREYFETQPRKVTKTGQQKLKLPFGELVLKPQEPEYEITDTDALVAQLQACEPMHKYLKQQAPKPDWKGLKAICEFKPVDVEDEITGETITGFSVVNKVTGEIIQGVSVTPREPKFVIDIKGGAAL